MQSSQVCVRVCIYIYIYIQSSTSIKSIINNDCWNKFQLQWGQKRDTVSSRSKGNICKGVWRWLIVSFYILIEFCLQQGNYFLSYLSVIVYFIIHKGRCQHYRISIYTYIKSSYQIKCVISWRAFFLFLQDIQTLK